MAYDNTNTFLISKNDKGDNEKRPDYKGSVNINGVEYWLSGWIRTKTSDGSKFISGTVQPKEEQKQAPAPAKKAAPPKQDELTDDDIPF